MIFESLATTHVLIANSVKLTLHDYYYYYYFYYYYYYYYFFYTSPSRLLSVTWE